MNSKLSTTLLMCAFASLVACGKQQAESEVALKPVAEPVYQSPGKPNVVPVDVKYRLLNEPKVGEEVKLELTFVSSVAAASVSYQMESEEGMTVAQDSAAQTFSSKPARTPEVIEVAVTPQREGRFYLKINTSINSGGINQTKVITIPIQVGTGTRQLESHGVLGVDDENNPIVSLPATEG